VLLIQYIEVPEKINSLGMEEGLDLFSSFITKPRYIEPATPEVEWNEVEAGIEWTTFGSGKKACRYQLCLPPEFTDKIADISMDDPKDPVRSYPFELDPFQKVSI
jgi:hypothetical protein